MNKFEKIKALDIKDFAKWMNYSVAYKCDFCKGYECDNLLEYGHNKCSDGIKQWLESEVRE